MGRVTASCVADVVAKTKTGYSASRTNYMADLIAERLTGKPTEGFTNSAMQWGTDKEPEARIAYEFERGVTVAQVGFVNHPRIDMTGASPDGLIGDDGLVEIKCPNTATHLETLLGAPIAAKYVTQMQWQMACTERRYCDFASFDPRLPASMALHIRRVERDDAMIADLEREVQKFLFELAEKIARLRASYGLLEAA